MATPQRVSPKQAHEKVKSDSGTLLICAYDSDQKFQQNQLQGAISLADLRERESSLHRDQELIFYCA